jgi:hypothetical protein
VSVRKRSDEPGGWYQRSVVEVLRSTHVNLLDLINVPRFAGLVKKQRIHIYIPPSYYVLSGLL